LTCLWKEIVRAYPYLDDRAQRGLSRLDYDRTH
jgi:hypothetical protein